MNHTSCNSRIKASRMLVRIPTSARLRSSWVSPDQARDAIYGAGPQSLLMQISRHRHLVDLGQHATGEFGHSAINQRSREDGLSWEARLLPMRSATLLAYACV